MVDTINFIPQTDEGLTDATSYVSLEEANQIYNDRYHNEAWTALSDVDKMRLLNTATNLIESKYGFRGEKVNECQNLEFPRRIYDSETLKELSPIPQHIKIATTLLAENISTTNKYKDNQTKNLSKFTVGPINFEFTGLINPLIPDYVYQLLRRYIRTFK